MTVLLRLGFLFIFYFTFLNLQGQNNIELTVKIENTESNKGKMMIALYKDATDFLEKNYKSATTKITDNSCTVTFTDIPKGVYAVSIFHDENDNNKLDTNFMGIPKEDYGCSNNAKGFMGPPKWKDAKFNLSSDKTITITL